MKHCKSPIILLLACCMPVLSQAAISSMQIEKAETEPEPFTDDEIVALQGTWVDETSGLVILIESVSPKGAAKVKLFNAGGAKVSGANITRYLEAFPMVNLTLSKNGETWRSYELLHDKGVLNGSCHDITSGERSEVNFSLKEDTKLSFND